MTDRGTHHGWMQEHNDMEDEPYTVQSIVKSGEVLHEVVRDAYGEQRLVIVPPGLYWFRVYYRTYHKVTVLVTKARDELEAFMIANKQLAKNKATADRRRAKTKIR